MLSENHADACLAHCLSRKLHLARPLTSKSALLFDFSGSRIAGPHGRASYLRKREVPYRP